MPDDRGRAAVAFVATLAVSVTLAAAAAGADDHTIVIENMRFQPEAVTAKAGERVVWVNKDLVPHTATAGDGAFDSHSIDPGQSWAYTATKAGEHAYACSFHPTMTGAVKVQ
jgi:plastocyanin